MFDTVAGCRRPADVFLLVAERPFERQGRAELDSAAGAPVDPALLLVLCKGLLEAVQPAAMLLDLVVEERHGLVGIEEPEQEDAQDRLVADCPVGAGLAEPALDFSQTALGD